DTLVRRLEALDRRGLNERLFLGLDFYEPHYAHYAPGAAYARHRDAFVGQRNRIISTVLYLNADWQEADGGELLVYDEAATTVLERVRPVGGTLVVFISERLPHEVLPARRSRYSIAGWFRQRSGTWHGPRKPVESALDPLKDLRAAHVADPGRPANALADRPARCRGHRDPADSRYAPGLVAGAGEES